MTSTFPPADAFSDLQVSSKGEEKPRPLKSNILSDKRWFRRNLVIAGAIRWNRFWDAVAYPQGK